MFESNLLSSVQVSKVTYEQTPYQSLEWVIPTIIEVYLGRDLLNLILKEGAKIGIDIFKEWIIDAIKTGKKVKSKRVDSRGEKKSNDHQSKDISFIVELPNTENRAKLMVDERLDDEVIKYAFSGFIDLLKEQYQNPEKEVLKLKPLKDKTTQLTSNIYAKFNPQTKEWEYASAEEIIQEKLKKK